MGLRRLGAYIGAQTGELIWRFFVDKQLFLVALDIAEDDASVVLDAAHTLANKFKARLVCLSVVRPLSGVYGSLYVAPYTTASIDFEKQALQQAHDRLLQLAARYTIDENDIHTKIGNPAADIRATAIQLKSDLVIMGTHARSGLGRLLGSTASAGLHGLPCDAYLVNVGASE